MSTAHDELQTENLLAKISGLEARVEELTLKLEKVAKRQIAWNEIDTRRMRLVDLDLMDAFERIKNMEFKLFPHLARDIVRLYEITGPGEDQEYNSLDYRWHK